MSGEPIILEVAEPHPGQQHILDNAGLYNCVRPGRRWGKALALDTPIPTTKGWSTMGALRVGDKVFDERGRACAVTFASESQTGRQCFDVRFSDGSIITADADHEWFTYTRGARRAARGEKWRQTKPAIVTTRKIAATLKAGRSENNHAIRLCKPLRYPNRSAFPVPPYVLGAWLGDGNTNIGRITSADSGILEALAQEGCPARPTPERFVYTFATEPRNKARRPDGTMCGNGGVHSRLKTLGVLGYKHIPKQYLHASTRHRLALLAGLMDTDGTVCPRGHCEYDTMLPHLADEVQELAIGLGCKVTRCTKRAVLVLRGERKDCGELHRVQFTPPFNPFRLERKRSRLRLRGLNSPRHYRFITGVHPTSSVPVRCIQVDSASHLYLAGRSCIATHNTELGVELAQQTTLAGHPCGWFAPEAKYHQEGWDRFIDRVRPLLLPNGTNKSTGVWTAKLVTGGVFHCFSLHNNPDAGRSRKYKRIIVDEAGLVKGLLAWLDLAAMATLLDLNGDAFLLGTPKLSSRDFNMLFRRGESGRDKDWRSFRGKTRDNIHIPNVDAWLAKRRKEMPEWQYAQEYEGEAADGIREFFKESMIEAHKATHAFEPLHRGHLVIPERYIAQRDAILQYGQTSRIQWIEDEQGPWKLWFNLAKGQPECRGPAKCMGADIGCGVGSSNSALSAGDSDAAAKTAEYASAGDSPEDLARIAAAFGYWLGGHETPARINFEANGPGEQFVKVLRQIQYPNIHNGRESAVKIEDGADGDYGWWNTPGSKYSLFSAYRQALTHNEFTNPSVAALDECLTYFIDKSNKVVCEREMQEGDPETGADVPHGDRPVADATLWQVMQVNPLSEAEDDEPPRGSFAYRQRKAQEAEEPKEQ